MLPQALRMIATEAKVANLTSFLSFFCTTFMVSLFKKSSLKGNELKMTKGLRGCDNKNPQKSQDPADFEIELRF
jgi:hypothetical protein